MRKKTGGKCYIQDAALHINQLDSLLSQGHLIMFQSVFTSRSTGLVHELCNVCQDFVFYFQNHTGTL